MESPTDVELLERLKYADKETGEMAGSIGLGNWTVMASMCLAFYALKSDDPEGTADENLGRVSLLIDHYGPNAGAWRTGPADGDPSGIVADRDLWINLFMQSQDYLNSVVEGYMSFCGEDREAAAIAGVGNHVNLAVATACMRHTNPKTALGRCRDIVRRTISFVREQCSFVEDRGPMRTRT